VLPEQVAQLLVHAWQTPEMAVLFEGQLAGQVLPSLGLEPVQERQLEVLPVQVAQLLVHREGSILIIATDWSNVLLKMPP